MKIRYRAPTMQRLIAHWRNSEFCLSDVHFNELALIFLKQTTAIVQNRQGVGVSACMSQFKKGSMLQFKEMREGHLLSEPNSELSAR